MRWFAVKLDANGKDIDEQPIGSLDRATGARGSVHGLDGTKAVLLVGVALGDWRFDFDPMDEVWEPHGWLLTVSQE
jgi:hypothetical protein